ncbi:MAG: hypothetical protein JWM63_2373 [Gammaproteobacteria bacterium]|nr:hypothetical protein [Gammaproteobacteria bacterium]
MERDSRSCNSMLLPPAERGDLALRQAKLPKDLHRIRSPCGRRALNTRGRAAESRSGRRLSDCVQPDVSAPLRVMCVIGRLLQVEHGRHADIDPFQQLAPLLPCSRPKSSGDSLFEARPHRAIHLLAKRWFVQSERPQQGRVEFRLERSDGDPTIIRAAVRRVEGRASIEQIGLARRAIVMAASTTWPRPERCLSCSAPNTPMPRSIPPPPKSPTRFNGITGPLSGVPMACNAPLTAM